MKAATVPSEARRWAIVGGGILGMRLAEMLALRGGKVDLFEGAPALGGLAGAWTIGDVTWDRHYHVILRSDQHLLRLLDHLDLKQELRWVRARTGFYSAGRLHSLSDTLDFLRFPLLSPLEKLRLAATILRAASIRDWRKLERIPVSSWLIRWSGRSTFERLWLPLLQAKLGDGYRSASAAFIWTTIARMYRARRAEGKREEFGFVPGGYARILQRYEDRLRELGVRIHLERTVRSVTLMGARLALAFAGGDRGLFDRVVVTLPAPEAARICSALAPEERRRLEGVRYQGIVCASLISSTPLSDFYITYITDSGAPFTGVIGMSALTGTEPFGGNSLSYLPKYVAPDDPAFGLSDDEVAAQFLSALERMYPQFRRSDVLAFRISRVRHVFPVPELDYSCRLPPIRTSTPGLFTVNSAQIVNGTLNVNETLGLAAQALALLET